MGKSFQKAINKFMQIATICNSQGESLEDLATRTLSLARGKGITLGTAESLTGGLIASVFTSVPGSSDTFLGGFVTYTNSVKQEVLGVKKETIEHFGVVSEQTVEEMALNTCLIMKCDLAVAVSGIAGPSGGSKTCPVGTVCFGLSNGEMALSSRFIFQGSRMDVRDKTVRKSLEIVSGWI